MTRPLNWTGILLAAGRGRRFDPSGNEDKLLQVLPDGGSVASQSVATLSGVVDHTFVVVRPDNLRLIEQLQGLQHLQQSTYSLLSCLDADDGMAASLTSALRHTQSSAGWIIALADMPFVQPSTIRCVLQALQDGADIAVPVYRGQRGHPVGFTRRHLPELLSLSGDYGARRLLQTYPVVEIAVDDPGILQDIDQPTDLNAYLSKK